MTESAAPRSHRREQAHHKADDLLDDLFEDLDSGLRTTPMLPRQWGSRFQAPIYPEGFGPVTAHKPSWSKWILGAGVIGIALAGWGLWRSYISLVAQMVEPQPFPIGTVPDSDRVGIPESAPALTTEISSETGSPTPVVAEAPEQPASSAPVSPARPAAARPLASSVAPPVAHRSVAPIAYAPSDPDVIRYIAPPPQRVQTSVNQPLPMKLVGTVSGPGTPMALILVDDVVREVPVGQTVLGSWRVQSVSRDGVILNNGQQGMAMHLGLGQGQ